VLLIVDYSNDYYKLFGKQCKLESGEGIVVEQTEWKDMHVEASSEGGAVVFLKKSDNPWPFSSQKEERIIRPDFCLFRNFPRDIHDNDYKNMVIALMFAGIPAVNSLHSLFMCMERPLVYAELLKISKKLGADNFSLIPMNYYPNQPISSSFVHGRLDPKHATSFPLVCKVSSTHAGYGKMRAQDEHDLKDLGCILALHKDYYTTEPLLEFEYEFRVQKIGDHYRAFRRNSDTSWKGNWGNLTFKDHDWDPKYKVWADECSKMFGGLDILALDVLHMKDGKDVIIELNDTACGLMFEHESEDLGHIKSLLLQRMNEAFAKNAN